MTGALVRLKTMKMGRVVSGGYSRADDRASVIDRRPSMSYQHEKLLEFSLYMPEHRAHRYFMGAPGPRQERQGQNETKRMYEML
jgi:hypothetical protein